MDSPDPQAIPEKYQRPLRRLIYYLLAMSVVGIAIEYVLAGTSPAAPNFVTGEVYPMQRPGKGATGVVFVTRESIMIDRFFMAHMIAMFAIGACVGVWRVAKKVIADSRYVEGGK